MRHAIAAVLTFATLTACGSEGPNAPQGATASFAVSARVVPVRCALSACPARLPLAIPVTVTESGGMIGGYVTRLEFVMRDAASGNVLESRRYDAAEIAAMTLLESNQVYPSASAEFVAHPFGVTDEQRLTRTVTVAVTVTDYHGNEHHQTLDIPIVWTGATNALITVRRAGERGRTDWGWLDSRHTFSFGEYHDPKHMGFRSLRVINDDRVAAGGGFPTHSHRDIEVLVFDLA